MNGKQSQFLPIDDYGLIGNLQTSALVSKKGSIDFMCFPEFDSPSIFAALLDNKKGGCFSILPKYTDIDVRQFYLTDTAMLVTRFFCESGIGELVDWMMVNDDGPGLKLVRQLKVVSGQLSFSMGCSPRFGYGEVNHELELKERNNRSCQIRFHAEGYPDLYLTSSCPLLTENGDAYEDFSLKNGETIWFFLSDKPFSEGQCVDLDKLGREYYATCFDYWKSWIAQSKFKGRWVDAVLRSAITLKLLSSAEHGSFVASPTFGLPEDIGGERNWDYRYTWIRDAAFTMYAFVKLGFIEEATAFVNWVEKYCIEGDMHLVYSLRGGEPPAERTLMHLTGYKHSKPVRVGNAAHGQKQMDIYGELIDTLYLFHKYGKGISQKFWKHLCVHINYVLENWREPDHGIWEIRGEKKEFLHSRLMCWVAIDRAIRIAKENKFGYGEGEWEAVRDEIAGSIHRDFWHPGKKAYVQYKGADHLDASVLLMPLVLFIDIHDERWTSTMDAVERELSMDVLIYRYKTPHEEVDGLDGEEGAFTMCAFWYVECLARMGRFREASEHFAKIIGYGNDLRLFSEEITDRGDQIGNFPQALTHLALINAGIELEKEWYKLYGKKYDQEKPGFLKEL